MKNRQLPSLVILLLSSLLSHMSIQAQDISLPAPDRTGGKPLMQALNERQTIRSFTKDSLTIQAKEQFRFSSSGNASVDLYLNGKYLRKPTTLTGTSIKNLVINKNGIVQ